LYTKSTKKEGCPSEQPSWVFRVGLGLQGVLVTSLGVSGFRSVKWRLFKWIGAFGKAQAADLPGHYQKVAANLRVFKLSVVPNPRCKLPR